MPAISLCMIVRNEEDTLRRCVESARPLVDEIIIVDTGSTDNTRAIAAELTEHVYDFQWIDDFSAARNFAFSKATKDYILHLDADDVMLPEDQRKFLEYKAKLRDEVDAVMMRYNVGFDGCGNVTLCYQRERMVRRDRGYRWHEPVHEYLETGGNIEHWDVAVSHLKLHPTPARRNLNIYEKRAAAGEVFSPRALYYFARELHYAGQHSRACAQFTLFLDGGQGWLEDNINACLMLARSYASLGDGKRRMDALLRSFTYDLPRAEICCELGYLYKQKADYRRAAFWFETALRLDKPTSGFIQLDYYGYIPNMELCVCHDRLGNKQLALAYNERAAAIKPDDPAVKHNRDYFAKLGLYKGQDVAKHS